MVHIAFGPPAVEDVLALMRPGDILTHCFTGLDMKIVDDAGRLLDFAERAWDSGVVMDIGHGTGSFAYATAEALMAAGRPPDVISTDLHQLCDQRPGLRPADDDEQVPPPRHVAAGGRSRDDVPACRAARPRRGHAAAGLGCRRRALPRCWTGASRSTTSGARCARRAGCSSNTVTVVGGEPLEPLPPQPPAPWARAPIWPELQKEFSDRLEAMRELGHTPAALRAAAEAAEA